MHTPLHQYYFSNDQLLPSSDFNPSKKEQESTVYEVMRIMDGRPLFVEAHLDRLRHSMNLAGKTLWLEDTNILSAIYQLIDSNQVSIGNIRLACSWEETENASQQHFLLFFIPHQYPTPSDYKNGIKVALFHAERANPNAKIDHTQVRDQANQFIKEKGVFEVLLVNSQGFITEGSRSNCFIIKEGAVYTSPLKAVLPGITRSEVLKACASLGLPLYETPIFYQDLDQVDALFITGTSPGVLPIAQVDDILFPAQQELVQAIHNAYEQQKFQYIKTAER